MSEVLGVGKALLDLCHAPRMVESSNLGVGSFIRVCGALPPPLSGGCVTSESEMGSVQPLPEGDVCLCSGC